MEPEGLLQCSEERSTVTYPETSEFSSYPYILPAFNETLIDFKNPQISFMKIRQVGEQPFHADRETDRQTYMTKPIVA